jgi:predicted nucleic acid-binding protein
MPTVDANVWSASFDTTDVFHTRSVAFLRTAASRNVRLAGPAFVLVEVACVVARRFRDPRTGMQAVSQMVARGLIQVVPLNEALLTLAAQLGTQQFLRGADALYAASAQLTGDVLVSWDNELIRRAGALTPTDWLAANP